MKRAYGKIFCTMINIQSNLQIWGNSQGHQKRLWIAVPAILLFFFLALNSVAGDSETFDEHYHISSGLTFLRTGDPRMSIDTPPLIQAISALPLLTMPELKVPVGIPSWKRSVFSYSFWSFSYLMWNTNHKLGLERILFLSRLPIIYLTLGLALTGFHFGRELWGVRAGQLIFLMLLFDPNILAHGRYATSDIGAAFFIFLATYLLWRLWQTNDWNWQRWLWAGACMGLAFGSKLSALIMLGVWGVQAMIPTHQLPNGDHQIAHWRNAFSRLWQLFSAGFFAAIIVLAVYGFEWRRPFFLVSRLRTLNASGLAIPVPTFWAGIVNILSYRSFYPSYLLGEFSNTGFPLYFPIAFLVKTPVVMLLLFVVAIFLLFFIPVSRYKTLFIAMPVIIIFILYTQSNINIGYRHLLFILPFVYMIIGGLLSRSVGAWIEQQGRRWSNVPFSWSGATAILVLLAICNLILIDIWIHPHYLSYFNLPSGGPRNGYKILVDSNIDWGQDLLRLREWVTENHIEHINLSYFGAANPINYGFGYESVNNFDKSSDWVKNMDKVRNVRVPKPGVYAISVTNLVGLNFPDRDYFRWFLEREPDKRIGYSIQIYIVSEE